MKIALLRYFLSGFTCLAITAQAGTVFAATFEESVAQAKTAYDAGDYDKAVELLIQANRLQPNDRLLLNIARSYAKAGDCARSVAYYRAFARSDESEASLLKTAAKEAEDLKCTSFNRDTSGRITFDSVPTGAKVLIDGVEAGVTPFEAVLIPKGKRTFRFELEGYEPFERSVDVEVDADQDVKASLSEKVEEPVVVETPVEEPIAVAPAEKDMTPYYIAGGVTGVGVGLLIMGAVYDLSVIPSPNDDRKQYTADSQQYKDLTDQRDGEATIALVGYAGGGILAVGGAAYLTYLFLTDESGKEDGGSDAIEKRLGVVPVVGQDTVGVGLFGQF